MTKKLSVILPTLQKNKFLLNNLIQSLEKDSVVDEIILIDNSTQGFDNKNYSKVKTITPEKNLYVNPSWNLGIENMKNEYFLLINDDLVIEDNFCSKVVEKLEPSMGIVGMNVDKVYPIIDDYDEEDLIIKEENPPKFLEAEEMGLAFGIIMFGHKDAYFKIPEDMLIWCGDNYLFEKNKECGRQNYTIANCNVNHIGEFSSGEKRFTLIKYNDCKIMKKHFPSYKIPGQFNLLRKIKSFIRWKIINRTRALMHYPGKKYRAFMEKSYLKKNISKDKKNLFFCDYGKLEPDKNCGNRSSAQYMKLLEKIGYNVIYIEYKEWKHPHLTKLLSKYKNDIDMFFINRPNVFRAMYSMIKEIGLENVPVMYQGHDIHYMRERREYELTNDLGKLLSSRYTQCVEEKIWKQADYVLYYSQEEIDIVKQSNPNCKAYAVPLYLYGENDNTPDYKAEERNHLIFVGGFNHSPNVDAMIWFLNSIFPQVQKEIPDIKMYVVGSYPKKEILAYNKGNIVVTGYISDEELNNLYAKTKLAVVPLRYGAGVKGKIIEAILNKVPIITTDIGIEGIPNGENFVQIANDEEEFAKKIVELYNSNEKLNEISKKSPQFINKYFSQKRAIEIFENLLKPTAAVK